MGEVFLDTTLSLLSSDKQRTRSEGLADLKHILQRNKGSKLQKLNDKACHKVFESLFRFIAAERSIYNKGQTSSRSSYALRLSTCASVIRMAVDIFLRNLRIKTIRAIIDHITETIPVPGEGLWEPLSLDYIKSLVSLLRYRPHVEHLAEDDWEALIGFCLASIAQQDNEESQLSIRSTRSVYDDPDASDGRSTPSRMTPAPTNRERHSTNRNSIEEVMLCIQYLTATPNAFLQTTAQTILHGLVGFVESPSISVAGNAHQLAFSSINAVVTKVLFDQSELVCSSLLSLVPVIRRLWATTKLQALKDELLVTLMLSMVILVDAVQKDPSEALAHDIKELVSMLHSEYVEHSAKKSLQIDEIVFCQNDTTWEMPVYGPRLGNARSEYNWTVIWMIAELFKLSEDMNGRVKATESREESVKKTRLQSEIQDIFRDAVSATGTRRTCALQLIPFLESELDIETKEIFLKRLVFSISDDNTTVASWTMVALTSIANGPTAKSPEIRAHWPRVVDLATRNFSSPLTSRAASHLLCTILQSDLLDYSVAMEKTRSTLASANGPSAISDSSLRLWTFIARKRTQLDPGSAQETVKEICGWLREVWTLGMTDRIQTARVAAYARPLDLLDLLLSCTNRYFPIPHYHVAGPMGNVARSWFFLYENRELLEYNFHTGVTQYPNPWGSREELSLEESSREDPDDAAMLDLLRLRSESFLQAWHAMIEEKSRITPESLQIFASFCVVTYLFTSCLPQSTQSRSQELHQTCSSLWKSICNFLTTNELAFTHGCLELISPLLGLLMNNETPSAIQNSLKELVSPLSQALEHLRQSSKAPSDDDPMDLDDRFSTEQASAAIDDTILATNRNSTSLFLDADTYQRCVTVQLSTYLAFNADSSSSETSQTSHAIEYLTGLDEADILSAQFILPKVYRRCSRSTPSELLSILEDLGEKCLQSYEMERCEASLCVCIGMMASLQDSWTIGNDENLKESAMDLYQWFLEVPMARKQATPEVSIALAGLIQDVLGSSSSYGNQRSLPSPRTSLFTILREGDVRVKFSIAKFIPTLFEQFLFKDHDAIFDDILETLPRDPEWIEGIAVRLFVLSQLASRWHTLLRRSIYHLFETPAQVPQSLWYAEKCMRSVSRVLGLQDAKELFRLFSSQILYTWTETQDVMSMPSSIFGYENLQEMLLDVKDEVVGQMIMRAKEQETIELAKQVKVDHLEFLTHSFHKAEAYSIARDISTPRQGRQPKGVEPRLRKLIGAEDFMSEVEIQFPSIIAEFFKSLDYYDQIERAFSKREEFAYALDIQTWIYDRSLSHSVLPANQQPSFRARYLLDQIEVLCDRTGFEFLSIWTPSLASFVCRSLFETIHPALGSLHACSVIRKIRIVVCVAGPIILQDYPFEMTLGSLRPFLGDIYCSEDAIGVVWYLLEAGKSHLQETPRFAVGIAVTILLTLRALFSSSSENTTQESQITIVQATAQKFYEWLVDFFGTLGSSDWNKETKDSFHRILSLAEKFPTSPKSSIGQVGRDLAFEVLQDRDSATSLLSRPVADLVLSLVCPEFEQTSETGDNFSGSGDLDPSPHVVSLWNTLQNFDGGSQYRLWAAQVIGRSFAATGKIDELLVREQDISLFEVSEPFDQSYLLCYSKSRILRVLCDMLHRQQQDEVGLVERTLQFIISTIADYPDFQGCDNVIPQSLMKALIWSPYSCPNIPLSHTELERCANASSSTAGLTVHEWAREISLLLSNSALDDPVIGPLRKIMNVTPSLAAQLLPYVTHDVLLSERYAKGEKGEVRKTISAAFGQVLSEISEETIPHAQLVISCILYLRNQPVPNELTIVQRDKWLDIDFGEASSAAHQCGLQKTSLLFLEIQTSKVISGSRRTSVAKYEPPADLLHDVFKNIDDPDLFYGIERSSSLASVMEKLEYESSGLKNLLFQSARYDSEIQMTDSAESYGVLKALNSTNLQGIANTMLSASSNTNGASVAFDSALQAATSLQKWDLPVSPSDPSPSATVFRTFQGLNTLGSFSEMKSSVEKGLLATLDNLVKAGSPVQTGRSAIQLRASMRALGIMTEVSDTLHSSCSEEIEEQWSKITTRSHWLKTESYHEVGEVLSWHEALFSSIRKSDVLKSRTQLSLVDSRLLEAKAIRRSLEITRSHGNSQASLKSAINLSKMAEPSFELKIDGAAKFDLANVLWDQGEMTASIRMLQQLKGQYDLPNQAIPLSRAELLVTLGHHVAEARLEKPDFILQEYLYPAVKELKGNTGEEAGRVYHGFATFCDEQLRNPDGIEDFKRVEQLRDRKEQEVVGLEDMMKSATGKEREYLKNYRAKAKQWFDLDDREYQRLLRSREAFLQQCLENYLLCLRECDTYNNDALRFCALWLDNSASKTANSAVSQRLADVPSRKFAPLMNQLSSRLLDVSDDFQSLLTQLVYRICVEHPFHGMYQIFASSKSKGGKDQSSQSRFQAANQLVNRLRNDSEIGPTWVAVHNVNISYVRFAVDKPDSKYKSGAKVPLKSLTTGHRLTQDLASYKLPPPTMKISLRVDCDYSQVPTISKFNPEFTIASGVSAPKIVTAVASNGEKFKQLYKGGNDDLRQDAIMEQVFEQVSSLLKDHQPTRQRNLGIRTYKVLPLTSNAGIIEFVPNTIPLHDYLMPAHQKYFPKDMKPNSCRKHIADVQTRSFEQRVRTYRQVTEHFHPVMKYFFMENFNNPDDWFSRRLSYTRSTAAISILGHVLGLGDRHGHNILLDEKTGEVVHIDLGVAFEQGRILPVPEVVPFRLTRDLVDGFGVTKTEGVFRRCCEFTLEALRQESYSIMTILDVLRYDPLYSWTVSPLRMKKMQDDQEAGEGPPVLSGASDSKNEPSEADRALTVVAKKLSKTLSVTATVNELIQQATDEKNLALLYCGWAAYA